MSLDLFLVRHADAEPARSGQSDADRRLTDKGLKQAARLAAWAKDKGLEVPLIVSSPLIRARQTAEPLARALEAELITDARLAGGSLTASALGEILDEVGSPTALMLVGHEPDMSELVEELTGGVVDFKKATIALIRLETARQGGGELAWLIPPKMR